MSRKAIVSSHFTGDADAKAKPDAVLITSYVTPELMKRIDEYRWTNRCIHRSFG